MASQINHKSSSSSLTSPSNLPLNQIPSSPQSPLSIPDENGAKEKDNSIECLDHLKTDNAVLVLQELQNSGELNDDVEERENSGESHGGIKEVNVDGDDDVEERENRHHREEENENENDSVRKGDEKEERGKEWNRRQSGGGGGGGRFPVRPDAEDCSFYVRTGNCKFGMNCKFNHPLNYAKSVHEGSKVNAKEDCIDSKEKDKDESLEKEPIDCKYFDRPGGCKFGKACKFNHSKRINTICKLNFMGLPVRPGEKECPFYMRNGSCKFGANCKFNHPEPKSPIGASNSLPGFNNGGPVFSPNTSQSSYLAWSPSTPLKESPPYVPLIVSPTQGVPTQPEWNSYQTPFYVPERTMKMGPTYGMNSQLGERPDQMVGDEFPERPGQPECTYFLKTGTCKYKSACKFHHPKRTVPRPTPCVLSDLGLPLRPGENVCSHYSRYGICKYGPACKYDHPINYAHSSDMNVRKVDQTPVLVNSMVNNQAMVAGS